MMVILFWMELNTQAMVEDEGEEEDQECKIYVVRPKYAHIHEKDHFSQDEYKVFCSHFLFFLCI